MHNSPIRRLFRQFKGFDWSLIKGSTILSIGMALARILGLAFSLVLAAEFQASEYGEIRYAITVASIVAIGTMPFGQHVIARFVSKYRSDPVKLDQILSNSFWVLSLIFGVTLLICVPIMLVQDTFNIGILAIFLGETLFYTYWGLSSGFLDPRRLTVAYLGSNFVQIILVFVLIQLLGIKSPTLALSIYGLSYLPPLVLLVIFWPLPGHFQFQSVDRNLTQKLLHFSIPIWISHACYTLSVSLDLLLLERLGSASQLGAYSLARTLASMFLIIPSGISTLLMPKMAITPKAEHRQSLIRMLTIFLLADGIALLVYLPLIQPLTLRIFGAGYLIPFSVSLILSFYMIAYGIHGMVTAVFVGSGKPQIESVSRILELITTGLFCWLLIPNYGAVGAAMGMLVGKGIALLVYALMRIASFSNFTRRLSNLLVEDNV